MIKEEDLIESTKRIIKDASVENGAIVAANTDKKYYPRDASPYRYVWMRDAFYTCVAADVLGIPSLAVASSDYYRAKMNSLKLFGTPACRVVDTDVDEPKAVACEAVGLALSGSAQRP